MALQNQNKLGNIHRKDQMRISDSKATIDSLNDQMKKIAATS